MAERYVSNIVQIKCGLTFSRLKLLTLRRDCAVSSTGFLCLLGWPTNPGLLLSRFVGGGMQFIQEMPIFKHAANVLDQRRNIVSVAQERDPNRGLYSLSKVAWQSGSRYVQLLCSLVNLLQIAV
jgi:hypothetical protein